MQTTSTVDASYSFNVETAGDLHTITYKRAKYSPSMIVPLLVPSLVLAIPLGEVGGFSMWVFVTLIFATGIYFIVNSLRANGCFSISKDAFLIKEKQYNTANISNLFIKAPNGYEQTAPLNRTSTSGIIIGGGDRVSNIGFGAAAGVAATVNVAAQAGRLAMQSTRKSFKKHYDKVNYSIGFMYGEKEVKLAGGLTENTAKIMVDKILELTQSVF